MTVHARGYRAHAGRFGASPAFLAIAGSSLQVAWRRPSFRRIGVLYLIWLAICAFVLYAAAGSDLEMFFNRAVRGLTGESRAVVVLNEVFRLFYSGTAFLTALLAIFVGAPLIADDLASGAIALYLVRPLRAFDYVLGKALVIPGVLAAALLLPGTIFYVLVGMWQPPGETGAFLQENLALLGRVVEHYLVATGLYTGLVLLLSSRTSRRVVVAVVAGGFLFAGVMLRIVAHEARLDGALGDVLRLLDLPRDTITVFLPHVWSFRRWSEPLASATAIHVLAAALFLVGFLAAWRRARTVEVMR